MNPSTILARDLLRTRDGMAACRSVQLSGTDHTDHRISIGFWAIEDSHLRSILSESPQIHFDFVPASTLKIHVSHPGFMKIF